MPVSATALGACANALLGVSSLLSLLQMMDSSGRRSFDLGSRDQCEMTASPGNGTFPLRYCVVSIPLGGEDVVVGDAALLHGVCIPQVCLEGARDATAAFHGQPLLAFAMALNPLPFAIAASRSGVGAGMDFGVNCSWHHHRMGDGARMHGLGVFLTAVLSVFAAAVLLASCLLAILPSPPKVEDDDDTRQQVCGGGCRGCEEGARCCRCCMRRRRRWRWEQLALQETGASLCRGKVGGGVDIAGGEVPRIAPLSAAPPKADLTFLHGLRTVTMLLVLLGHTVSVGIAQFNNPLTVLRSMRHFAFLLIFNAPQFGVDTSFILSGLLGAATLTHLLGALPRRGSSGARCLGVARTVGAFYLHRALRLWPMLLAVVCFTAYVLPFLTWGPFWASAMAASRACQERGWANTIFLNNFLPAGRKGVEEHMYERSCIPWTWYVAVDVQLYLTLPLFVIPFRARPLWGYALTAFAFVACIAAGAAIVRLDSLSSLPSLLPPPPGDEHRIADYGAFLNLWYDKPWTRAPPFLIGIVLSFLFFPGPDARSQSPSSVNAVGRSGANEAGLDATNIVWKGSGPPSSSHEALLHSTRGGGRADGTINSDQLLPLPQEGGLGGPSSSSSLSSSAAFGTASSTSAAAPSLSTRSSSFHYISLAGGVIRTPLPPPPPPIPVDVLIRRMTTKRLEDEAGRGRAGVATALPIRATGHEAWEVPAPAPLPDEQQESARAPTSSGSAISRGASHPCTRSVLFFLCFAAMLVIVFAPFDMYRDDPRIPLQQKGSASPVRRTEWGAASVEAYTALAHPCFSVVAGICLLLLMLQDGAGGLERAIVRFLSAPLWAPLARVSFSLYLSHSLLIAILYQSRAEYLHFSPVDVTVMFAGNVFLSYLLAFVLYGFIERPCVVAEKWVFTAVRERQERLAAAMAADVAAAGPHEHDSNEGYAAAADGEPNWVAKRGDLSSEGAPQRAVV